MNAELKNKCRRVLKVVLPYVDADTGAAELRELVRQLGFVKPEEVRKVGAWLVTTLGR